MADVSTRKYSFCCFRCHLVLNIYAVSYSEQVLRKVLESLTYQSKTCHIALTVIIVREHLRTSDIGCMSTARNNAPFSTWQWIPYTSETITMWAAVSMLHSRVPNMFILLKLHSQRCNSIYQTSHWSWNITSFGAWAFTSQNAHVTSWYAHVTSWYADGISRYSVLAGACPLLPGPSRVWNPLYSRLFYCRLNLILSANRLDDQT